MTRTTPSRPSQRSHLLTYLMSKGMGQLHPRLLPATFHGSPVPPTLSVSRHRSEVIDLDLLTQGHIKQCSTGGQHTNNKRQFTFFFLTRRRAVDFQRHCCLPASLEQEAHLPTADLTPPGRGKREPSSISCGQRAPAPESITIPW